LIGAKSPIYSPEIPGVIAVTSGFKDGAKVESISAKAAKMGEPIV